jgi:hypothetical protein
MTSSLTDLQKSLLGHGHLAKPISGNTLIVRLPNAVKEECPTVPDGPMALISPTADGSGLAVECCWALNAGNSAEPEKLIEACAQTAFKVPLVRVQQDPRDGEIRLRVDCLGSADTIPAEHVIRSLNAMAEFLSVLKSQTTFAEGLSESPTVANEPIASRSYDPKKSTDAPKTHDASPLPDSAARLEALARKPGGINRLEKLLQINQQRKPPETPSSN